MENHAGVTKANFALLKVALEYADAEVMEMVPLLIDVQYT